MSRLFRRPSSKVPSPQPHAHPDPDAGLNLYDDSDPASAYSSLLSEHDPASDGHDSPSDHDPAAVPVAALRQPHRRTKSSPLPSAWGNPEFAASRPWLSTVEGRPSWTGERPPTRKLVKDPHGSARPSMSIELSDSDGEKEKGLVKRGFERLRGLYRKER